MEGGSKKNEDKRQTAFDLIEVEGHGRTEKRGRDGEQ